MKKYRLFGIEWDTDGESVDLPAEVLADFENDSDISDRGADYLSDTYGWLVFTYSFAEIGETHAGD